MSRVELFDRTRRDNRDLGSSTRALADTHHVHRPVVRQALSSVNPPPRKVPEREAPEPGPWMALVTGR